MHSITRNLNKDYPKNYFLDKYAHIQDWDKDFGAMYKQAKKNGDIEVVEEMKAIEDLFDVWDRIEASKLRDIQAEEFYILADDNWGQSMSHTGLFEFWQSFAPDFSYP